MSRSIEKIERELERFKFWYRQADLMQTEATRHANSLAREIANLIDALNQARKEVTNET